MDSGQIGAYGSYINRYDTMQAAAAKETDKLPPDAENHAESRAENPNLMTENAGADLQGVISNALKAAGIVQNDKTAELVKVLLFEQQPIDRNTLISYNRLIGQFPDADIHTLVLMKKSNFPITEEMLAQFKNYSSNEHRLINDIGSAAEEAAKLADTLINTGDKEAAVRLLDGIMQLVKDMGGSPGGADGALPGMKLTENESAVTNAAADIKGTSADYAEDNNTLDKSSAFAENITEGKIITADVEATGIGTMTGKSIAYGEKAATQADIAENSMQSADVEAISSRASAADSNIYRQAASADINAGENTAETAVQNTYKAVGEAAPDRMDMADIVRLVKELLPEEMESLSAFPGRETLKETIKRELADKLVLRPEQAADKESVTAYYKRLEGAVERFTRTMKELPDTPQTAAVVKNLRNMSDNISFMHYINEWLPYVQLPLRLVREEAHGDFYVLRNKNSRYKQGEELTALLHLDMEQLGSMDIFVKLKSMTADVNFNMQNTVAAEFVEQRLGLLKERLEAKGYKLFARVEKKAKEFSLVKDFIAGRDGENTIERFSFDVKA